MPPVVGYNWEACVGQGVGAQHCVLLGKFSFGALGRHSAVSTKDKYVQCRGRAWHSFAGKHALAISCIHTVSAEFTSKSHAQENCSEAVWPAGLCIM